MCSPALLYTGIFNNDDFPIILIVIIELLKKKRKVEKENSRLAAQVEELKQRLADLERAKVVTDGGAPPTRDEVVDTGASSERVRS